MKLSLLNLVPVRAGQTYKDAIDSMVALVQHAESIGLERYWIAEHHNMKNITSSATDLLIQRALDSTSSIRVGSGGVMLPNHSPLVVAERYGTLETLYPGRVDLGLGRAPGTDMRTAYALRRNQINPNFPEDIAELRGYFKDDNLVHAYPGAGLNVPFYMLGSSTDSAYLAAELGLPYSFAAHFAPDMMYDAVQIYRNNFEPSEYLSDPYVILGANAVLATTDDEAHTLATTQTMFFLNVVTNQRQPLQPPVESDDHILDHIPETTEIPHFGPVNFQVTTISHRERMIVERMQAISFVGSPNTVRQQITDLSHHIEFDEIMAQTLIYDESKQHSSYELLKEILDTL